MLLGLLLETLFQFTGEIVVELLTGVGDYATGGRMRRVLFFAAGGAVAGYLSHRVRPGIFLPDPVTRYAVMTGSILAGAVLLAFVESRASGRARGATAGGFLSGLAFGIAFVVVRSSLR